MGRQKRAFGERFHSALVRAYGLPEGDFSRVSVGRVMERLNAVRAGPALVAEVIWMNVPNAFTLPGRYVYLSRRLLERCDSDAPAALALAHEIAHHDLGHLAHVERWADGAGVLGPARITALAVHSLIERLYSRDNELAADAYALDLCLRAGFDGEKCLEVFDILSAYALDHRDLDAVFGSDDALELDPELAANPIDRLYIEARLWTARHRRRHPALFDRRVALRAKLHDRIRASTACPSDVRGIR